METTGAAQEGRGRTVATRRGNTSTAGNITPRQYKMKRRPPTVKQAEYLKTLCEQLGYEYESYDLTKLRMEEVSLIISELKEELQGDG